MKVHPYLNLFLFETELKGDLFYYEELCEGNVILILFQSKRASIFKLFIRLLD